MDAFKFLTTSFKNAERIKLKFCIDLGTRALVVFCPELDVIWLRCKGINLTTIALINSSI